jgi:hypothetical protein
VLLGAEVGREVEVREGLNLSDKLIATRLSELSPGMSVHATPARRER